MSYSSTLSFVCIVIVASLLIIYVIRRVGRRSFQQDIPPQEHIAQVLMAQVSFFVKLRADQQAEFIRRVIYFLQTTKISPEKGAEVSVDDRILVAASATIPLFHFSQWAYENLDEVLLYPSTFNEAYAVGDPRHQILGMVGNGVMNRKMILSLTALRAGFAKRASSNTAIHEFVHLIDMADGATDGIPTYLIPRELIDPWMREMEAVIRQIRDDESDIRDYAATDSAEFLAVVSEYFFQKPTLLQHDHPQLYAMLDKIYSQKKH